MGLAAMLSSQSWQLQVLCWPEARGEAACAACASHLPTLHSHSLLPRPNACGPRYNCACIVNGSLAPRVTRAQAMLGMVARSPPRRPTHLLQVSGPLQPIRTRTDGVPQSCSHRPRPLPSALPAASQSGRLLPWLWLRRFLSSHTAMRHDAPGLLEPASLTCPCDAWHPLRAFSGST